MKDGGYKDLIVWQKAMDLVVEIYRITDTFPKNEIYGLTAQMRRASVSIPCNIAEGKRRYSINEFSRFLKIAFGSAAELETQLEIALRLGFVKGEECLKANELTGEVLRILNKMTSEKS